jgi:hypothetical protein
MEFLPKCIGCIYCVEGENGAAACASPTGKCCIDARLLEMYNSQNYKPNDIEIGAVR